MSRVRRAGEERGPATCRRKAARVSGGEIRSCASVLAVEEPLEVHVDGRPVTVLMRLPGDDIHLAAGFCFSRGLAGSWDDFRAIHPLPPQGGGSRIMVRLAGERIRGAGSVPPGAGPNSLLSQGSFSGWGCRGAPNGEQTITLDDLWHSKEEFDARQALFETTGCTHSASIFDRRGILLAFGEDVGRRNAFDKAVGRLLLRRSLERSHRVIVSSRVNRELVARAVRLRVRILCGLSAPTSGAVSLAEEAGVTLIGFLRHRSLTLYTHPGRIRDFAAACDMCFL
ncbi:MAG: formate dehydrogenase family accessory protein FdhD [Desulfacinum sp.]|nr:formate dehydrogenase family accessory protein FdhD [Desulfacinum sp.]